MEHNQGTMSCYMNTFFMATYKLLLVTKMVAIELTHAKTLFAIIHFSIANDKSSGDDKW